MRRDQAMDVARLLEAASLLVPGKIATENGITLDAVWEYVTHDEWQVAQGCWKQVRPGVTGAAVKSAVASFEPASPFAQPVRAVGRRPSPEPASCDRCGTSESNPGRWKPAFDIAVLWANSRHSWGQASVPQCDSHLSIRRSGDTSSSAKGSPCTKTELRPERRLSLRFGVRGP